MKTTFLLLLLVSLLFTGCNENRENTSTTETSVHAKAENSKKSDWTNEIKLHKGSRWQANKETTAGILKMSALLESTSPKSVEEYKNLGEGLTQEVNILIKECTMEGPSHDNLHVYLKPLIIRIAQLREVRHEEEGKQLALELIKHLEAYHRYFI